MTVTLPPSNRPRIFRVSLRRADNGKRRWKLIKCPYYERDPRNSVFGLTSKLTELTMQGAITAQSVIVPAAITDKQREKLVRWPEALTLMLAPEEP